MSYKPAGVSVLLFADEVTEIFVEGFGAGLRWTYVRQIAVDQRLLI